MYLNEKKNVFEIIFRPQNHNLISFSESDDDNLLSDIPTHTNAQIQFNQ